MGEWSCVNRPVTVSEMSFSFRWPARRIEWLLLRHRIDPCVRIGRTRLYGPRQVPTIHKLICDAQARAAAR
jgi:hypothetical protein